MAAILRDSTRRRCRRRRRRVYAPTSNTASHDNHEKINSSYRSYQRFGMQTRLKGQFFIVLAL